VISEEKPVFSEYPPSTYYFQISSRSDFCGVKGGVFWQNCSLTELSDLIASYLEIEILPAIIQRVAMTTIIDRSAAAFRSFIVLNQTEPSYFIDVPSSLEFGESRKISWFILPDQCKCDNVEFRSLNNNVAIAQSDRVEGVGTGETFIEARHSSGFIGSYPIRVIRRIRATSISFASSAVQVAVGEKMCLEIVCDPYNADNISLMQFDAAGDVISFHRESNTSVLISAQRVGRTRIVAQLNDLTSVSNISVFPKLERLEITADKQSFRVGGIAKVSVAAVPRAALIGDLQYDISPAGIARFDIGVGALIGKNRGNG
jgi:hypothetical protein